MCHRGCGDPNCSTNIEKRRMSSVALDRLTRGIYDVCNPLPPPGDEGTGNTNPKAIIIYNAIRTSPEIHEHSFRLDKANVLAVFVFRKRQRPSIIATRGRYIPPASLQYDQGDVHVFPVRLDPCGTHHWDRHRLTLTNDGDDGGKLVVGRDLPMAGRCRAFPVDVCVWGA